MPHLQYANLVYGSMTVPVPPTETHPLPQRFDFDDPIECAKRVCAIMSNACGGNELRDCRLRLHLPTERATVAGHNFSVFYGPTLLRPLLPSEALRIVEETTVFPIGNVQAAPGLRGWENPRWVASWLRPIPSLQRLGEPAPTVPAALTNF